MPEYVAEDLPFIAARLKEIEEEKRRAREAPPATNNPSSVVVKAADEDAWMGY